MAEPVVVADKKYRLAGQGPVAAAGKSFEIYEWTGSGPEYLHVHYSDDEAWYVLDGMLTFRLGEKQIEAPAGTTVFVPAGVAHAYAEANGPARYLIILTPRLRALIEELHNAPFEQHAEVMKKYDSAIVGG